MTRDRRGPRPTSTRPGRWRSGPGLAETLVRASPIDQPAVRPPANGGGVAVAVRSITSGLLLRLISPARPRSFHAAAACVGVNLRPGVGALVMRVRRAGRGWLLAWRRWRRAYGRRGSEEHKS